ncbi:MAG: MAC/perforin domain-containing protein [Treponemataceae bacterium]
MKKKILLILGICAVIMFGCTNHLSDVAPVEKKVYVNYISGKLYSEVPPNVELAVGGLLQNPNTNIEIETDIPLENGATRKGKFIFDGWIVEKGNNGEKIDELWNFSTDRVQGNMTLRAAWIEVTTATDGITYLTIDKFSGEFFTNLQILPQETSVTFTWDNPPSQSYNGLTIWDNTNGTSVMIGECDAQKTEFTQENLTKNTVHEYHFEPRWDKPVEKTETQEVPFRTREPRIDFGYLGRGYDIISSNYFNAAELKMHPIINVDAILSEGKEISKLKIDNDDSTLIIGKDISEYANSLSLEVGVAAKYGVFKGDIKTNFNKAEELKAENSYVKSHLNIRTDRVSIDESLHSVESLRPYLTAGFKDDMVNLSAKGIIDKYGTHVLDSINLGGRLQLNWEYHNTSNLSKQNIQVAVNASVSFVKTNASISLTKEAKQFNENSSLYTVALGGEHRADIGGSLDSAVKAYEGWAKTVPSNPTFIEAFKLVEREEFKTGIWLFAPDEAKRTAIKNEYVKRLEDARKYYENLVEPAYVKDIGMIFNTSPSKARKEIGKALGHTNFIIVGDLSNEKTISPFRAGGTEEKTTLFYVPTSSYEESVKGVVITNIKSSNISDHKKFFEKQFPKLNIDEWKTVFFCNLEGKRDVFKEVTTYRTCFIWQSKTQAENGLMMDINDKNKVHPIQEIGVYNSELDIYSSDKNLIPNTIVRDSRMLFPKDPEFKNNPPITSFYKESPRYLTWRRKPYAGEK